MNFLQRMPQSAKIALASALLIGAVAVWYLGFFRPSQTAQQPSTPIPTPAPVGTPTTPATPPATTARPLEVLPLPFLVTETPRPSEAEEPEKTSANAALARPRVTVPPNPFVPLIIETAAPAPTPTAMASPPTPAPAVTAQPIPSQTTRVQVRQPTTALPSPSLPGTRPTPLASSAAPAGEARLAPVAPRTTLPSAAPLGSGMLPIRLAPLERELSTTPAPAQEAAALDGQPPSTSGSSSLDFARAEIDTRLAQVLEPKSSLARSPEIVQESSLARFVRELNLRLSGVVLGPTSVAIFQTKDGFVVLPVGRTLPGSDVLLKSLSAREALLVQGSESLNLTIDTP
ncbi:hypothetical protein [Meiothermus rufus]|uniref:hypothetical protein n=1 Tax=Meiothermus rufus TaxID=604332 RepID=UPI0004216153|nr:hypothetical protein [Meiothermus rufus]